MNMKIEKLSDNQIRCTLTRADLAARQLHLSELAYGTEKAKSLFRDMMQQAAFEFGFEADDIPLMIEAIPSSADSIVLIITKVEDPEELDTRFSKFAPASGAETDFQKNPPSKLEGADDEKSTASGRPALRLFSFSTLDNVQKAAGLLSSMYSGSNTLYKDEGENVYILALSQSGHTDLDFNRICNMLSEYGSLEKTSGAALAFLEEHCKTIISADAVRTLASIS